jgi:hypothetical protein
MQGKAQKELLTKLGKCSKNEHASERRKMSKKRT